MDRRHFLSALVAALAAACSREVATSSTEPTSPETTSPRAPTTTTTAPDEQLVEASDPAVDPLEPPTIGAPVDFTQGVSSGEPRPTSVALWTRLDGLDTPADFVWEVASDPRMETLIATGLVTATPERDHTVIVEPTLDPATTYWYRFRADGATSPVGRTRTTADPDSPAAPLRIAVSSCQRGDRSRAALVDLAAHEVDLGIWLGDFVYADADDLDGYRSAYRSMRSESHVKVAAASTPWLMLWDDHEVADNVDRTIDDDRWLAAARAWHEHMPTRLVPPELRRGTGRTVELGDLCRVVGLDTRTWRDPSPRPGQPVADGVAAYDLGPEMETTTMLGPDLDATLDALDHTGAWTLLASSVLFGGFSVNPISPVPVVVTDTWDGYAGERAQLVDALEVSEPDAVVVSGDFHHAMALDVRRRPFETDGPVVATELMAPPTSSAAPSEVSDLGAIAAALSPHIDHFDPAAGWLLLTIDHERIVAEFRTVDAPDEEWSASSTTNSYIIERGRPGLA